MPAVESSVVLRLFEQYYANASAESDPFTSSHWKELHENARVEVSEDGILKLAATGFGDLQNKSLVYRFFSCLTIICYLMILKNRVRILAILPSAIRLSRRMGLHFSYDAFRQVCTLAALEPYFKSDMRLLNIGDGYGFFSALVKTRFPKSKITCVDLGKTLLFQAHFCQKAFAQSTFSMVGEGQTDFIFCPAEQADQLYGKQFDLAVNIASMQEMNASTVSGYFKLLRQVLKPDGFFYCCNREEKQMPAGEISRLADYPWDIKDRFLWDEVCPWYRFFFAAHRMPKGPQIAGFRLFFINYFDGVVRHRLVKLNDE